VLRETTYLNPSIAYRKQYLTLYLSFDVKALVLFTNIRTGVDQPVGTNIPDTSYTRWGEMEVASDNGMKKENNLR
jgi:hypothetical protein